jgi:flagellar biosynthesis protein FlhF
MRILKFEGTSMREALAKVKAELGDQAVVVSTRQIKRGLLGSAYEIAAAIDDDRTAAPGPTFTASGAIPTLRRGGDDELERAMAPLRAELRTLRAMMRAKSDERPANEVKGELAALRRALEDLRAQHETSAGPAGEAGTPATPAPVFAMTARCDARALLLAGPTGVGKTTTIAKIAARAALIDGRRVAVITLDNYRVGGVDQIRTFADLIGVPLYVLDDPGRLALQLEELTSYDLVLIDTAGRNPRDRGAIATLERALRAAPQVQVHLVVAAGSSSGQIDELYRRFAPLAPRRLLFTKVDECEEAPELTAAPMRLRLPVTWIATGQAVPEDLEVASPARLDELARLGLSTNHDRPVAA